MKTTKFRRIFASFTVTIAFVVAGFVLAMYIYYIPAREMQRWNETIIAILEDSKSLPPPEIKKEKWEEIVGWTQVAFPNCFYLPVQIVDTEDFDEFKEKSSAIEPESVNMRTIAWLWEGIERHSKVGRRYSEKFRPITPIGSVHDNGTSTPESD